MSEAAHSDSGRSDSGFDGSSGLDAAIDGFLDWHSGEADSGDGVPPELVPGLSRVSPGTRLGEFVLGQSLGSGSMGVVFEATQDSVSGRTVAVKIMRSLSGSPRAAARFRREITAIGRLDHPAIVPIVAAGVEQGLSYFAMKLVQGVSLRRVLERLKMGTGVPRESDRARSFVARHGGESGGGSSVSHWEASHVRWSARLCLDLADALQHAHDKGLVHRDVKPGNILVEASGSPVLLDFGLASLDEQDLGLTRDGDFLGTLDYAAPEQIRGETVDGRADVWSLGVVLYELLSLRRPYEAAHSADLLHSIEVNESAPLGRHVPRDLATICRAALAPGRARRYSTAGALASDLRAFLCGEPIRARPPGLAARLGVVMRRHPRAALAAGCVVLVVAAFWVRDWARAVERLEQGDARWAAAGRTARELDAVLAARIGLLSPSGLRVELARDVPLADELAEQARSLRASWDQSLVAAEDLYRSSSEVFGGYAPAHRSLAALYAERIRRGLNELDDLFRPAQLADWVRRLAETDHAERFVSLRDGMGAASIRSRPPGATVRVMRSGSAQCVGATRVTPLRLDALPAGSYVAHLAHPGYASVSVPFLVRPRAAVWPGRSAVTRSAAGEIPPWAALDVELIPEDEVPPGWVHVPGGWSLVGDGPPRWREVGTVLMQRCEVTYADWIGFLDHPSAPPVTRDGEAGSHYEFLPRFSDDPDQVHLVRGSDGRWQPGPDIHDLQWPVRGLSLNDMYTYRDYLMNQVPVCRPGYELDLPSELEWERAARGADGRAYPWGEQFHWERCAGFFSRPDPSQEPWPVPVRHHAGDVSVFGVRDLAGSVAEMTRDSHGPGRDLYSVHGGSYDSREKSDFHAARRRAHGHGPGVDIGFRLVQRALPDWMRPEAAVESAFRDDFDRRDSEDVGHGWVELNRQPFSIPGNRARSEDCSIRDGQLVVRGGEGNFSNVGYALHPLLVDEAGVRIATRLRFQGNGPPDGRGVGLHCLEPKDRDSITLLLGADGLVQLNVSGKFTARRSLDGFVPGAQVHLELRLTAGQVEARAWVGDPALATELSMSAASPPSGPRLVGVSVSNLLGLQLEVDDFVCEGLR